MNYQFRPLQAWPREFTKGRKQSRFDSAYAATLGLLEAELTHIAARNVVIQLALQPSDIRVDGRPRASARPSHPGVIVSFERWMPDGTTDESGEALGNYQLFSFPCDTFNDWKANLRAIALTFEALRKIDRYGVTQNNQQYTGWAALPPAQEEIKSPESAAAFIAKYAGTGVSAATVLKSRDAAQLAYRGAARVLHPDNNGTDVERFTAEFQKLQTAWGILRKYQENNE